MINTSTLEWKIPDRFHSSNWFFIVPNNYLRYSLCLIPTSVGSSRWSPCQFFSESLFDRNQNLDFILLPGRYTSSSPVVGPVLPLCTFPTLRTPLELHGPPTSPFLSHLVSFNLSVRPWDFQRYLRPKIRFTLLLVNFKYFKCIRLYMSRTHTVRWSSLFRYTGCCLRDQCCIL